MPICLKKIIVLLFLQAVPRKIYANAHAYHINSISLNTDGETYISADDLRINLWNLEISDQSFSTYRLLVNFTKYNYFEFKGGFELRRRFYLLISCVLLQTLLT